jgi:DNA-binding transcriptional LysR family regulator
MLLAPAPAVRTEELGGRLGGVRLDEIHSFLVLAEELHFGRAAGRLFVSPGGLSRRIAHLEQALGGPLVKRTSRRVQLTPYGHRIDAVARVLVADLQDAQRFGALRSA